MSTREVALGTLGSGCLHSRDSAGVLLGMRDARGRFASVSKGWLRDLWRYTYRSDTFPQKQLGAVLDPNTAIGKLLIAALVGEGGGFMGLNTNVLSAGVQYLLEAGEYYARH